MSKSRMAVLGAVAALALLLVGGVGQAAAQTTPTSVPASQVVKMTGTAKNGKKFRGTFTIQRFTTKSGKLVAHGKLVGRLKGKRVKRIIDVPVAPSSDAGSNAIMSQAGGSCQVLHLVLGPLDLDLLGLKVHLDRVVLDVTAQRGPGNLLGNLLCALTGLLDQNALQGPLSQIAAALNSILALLPRTA